MAGQALRVSLSECQQEACMGKLKHFENNSREHPWQQEDRKLLEGREAVEAFYLQAWRGESSDLPRHREWSLVP
jgi:hypothetical protein